MNLQEKADRLIAQGALTNSKRPETFIKGVYPTHLKNGNGCYVWDYENKKYFDFITGLGSNLLGYANQEVNTAISHRLTQGITLSLGTQEELDLAERLKIIFPFVDCMKFLKTGTEACMAAVRIARAYTHRKLILSAHYHGWSDGFVSLSPPSIGCPEQYDHSEEPLFYIFDEDYEVNLTYSKYMYSYIDKNSPLNAAAIIIEPITTDFSDSRIEWLRRLREFCTKNGVLLIFDEVITGFRFPQFSVANYYGIEPDIICLGKAMANGMPISCVAGKKEIMNCGEYFISSTFAGETLSLAAAKKTMELLQTKYKLKDLWEKGEAWLTEFNSFYPEKIKIEGYPTRGRFVGDSEVKALLFQEACEAGILLGPSWFFNFPLSEENHILASLKEILCKIKKGNVKLKGEMPKSPFSEKMRKKA